MSSANTAGNGIVVFLVWIAGILASTVLLFLETVPIYMNAVRNACYVLKGVTIRLLRRVIRQNICPIHRYIHPGITSVQRTEN